MAKHDLETRLRAASITIRALNEVPQTGGLLVKVANLPTKRALRHHLRRARAVATDRRVATAVTPILADVAVTITASLDGRIPIRLDALAKIYAAIDPQDLDKLAGNLVPQRPASSWMTRPMNTECWSVCPTIVPGSLSRSRSRSRAGHPPRRARGWGRLRHGVKRSERSLRISPGLVRPCSMRE